MICTALRAHVVYQYMALGALLLYVIASFSTSRPMHLDQSLTARTGATIVGYASRLGGYVQKGAGNPPGAS
jgi:hypothetical protein